MIITGISDEAGKDIYTQIKAHKQLGWKALELRLHNGVNASTTDFTDQAFDEVRKALEENDMAVTGFGSAIGNWARPIRGDFQKDIDDLKVAAKRMNILGTKFIRTMTWVPDENDMVYSKNEAIRRYKELVKIAEDTGIYIAHENCTGWGGLTPENMIELKEAVDSSNLKLLYDTGNVPAHGDDPWTFFLGMRKHIDYIHIKDSTIRKNDRQEFRYVGEGEALVPEILKVIIKEDKYDGVISIEPHVSQIVHEKGATPSAEEMYHSYIKYGTMLENIISSL
ncbi:MAG: sugar phosphate isomerase/epimerase [Clostridia bacterium]|nr:sugar phosphate isomerase/epimerase [Clostridia bacterium]